MPSQEYQMVGPTSPQPIALPCCPEIGTCGDRMQGKEQHYKIPEKQYKIPPALQALQRSSLPFPCANYELCQHDVRLPHSAALPPPLPHTFTPNPPSNSTSIALIRVSLHFCRLWAPNLVSGCWVCAENQSHNLLCVQDRSPSTSFFCNHRCTQQHAVICVSVLHFRPCGYSSLYLWVLGFALKYLSTDFLGLKSLQTSVIFAAPSSIALIFVFACISGLVH